MKRYLILPLLLSVSFSAVAESFNYNDPETRRQMNDASLIVDKFKGKTTNGGVDFNAKSNQDSVSTGDSMINGSSIIAGKSSIDPRFVLDNESASSGQCIAGVNDGATRSEGGTLQECKNGLWSDMDIASSGGVQVCEYKVSQVYNNSIYTQFYALTNVNAPNDAIGISPLSGRRLHRSRAASTYSNGQTVTFKHGETVYGYHGGFYNCPKPKTTYTCLSGQFIVTQKGDPYDHSYCP